jgi:hypothetical protein
MRLAGSAYEKQEKVNLAEIDSERPEVLPSTIRLIFIVKVR